MKMCHNVREALEYAMQELEQKANEAYAAGEINAWDRFTDAKYHIMRANNTLRAKSPYNYQEVINVKSNHSS